MLSKFSVKKPLTVIVVVIIVLILGVVSYTSIGVDLYPDMNMPYLIVATILPGASPEEIESTVTAPIESEISAMSGISTMTSVSSEHVSMVIVELNSDEDLDAFVSELSSTLDLVAWPDNDLLQDPIIVKIDPSMLPIMTIALGRTGYTTQESTEYFESIINSIDKIDGVSSVTTSGLVSNLSFVSVDEDKLNSSLVSSVADMFGIDLTLSDDDKEAVREVLCEMFAAIIDDPAYQDESGNLDATKILDDLIIPFIEGMSASDFGGLDVSSDNDESSLGIAFAFRSEIVDLLKNDAIVRAAAIDAIDTVASNTFVLEDGEENKAILFSMIDDVVANITMTFVESMLGGMSDMLTTDLFELLFTAQDFEMPAGSITIGETSWIVKVGETIADRDELYDLPLMTIDLGSTIESYVDQAQEILTLMVTLGDLGQVSDDGVFTITEEQLYELAELISFFNAETYSTYEEYATWAVNYIADNITVPAYWLNDEAREVWISVLKVNADFKAYVDGIEEGSTSWRSGMLNLIANNSIYMPEGTTTNGDYQWTEVTNIYFELQIRSQAGSLAIAETAYESMDDTYKGYMDSMFAGMSTDEVYNLLETLIGFIGTQEEDGSFKVDFVQIREDLEARQEELQLCLKLGDVSNISFLDDSGSQIATLITNVDGEFVSSSSVQIYIEKETDASTATITEEVAALLATQADTDSDFTYTILDDDGELINMMVTGVLENLIYGALFAALVLFLFLKKIKATLIVVSSILISVVSTFVMMYFSGMTLNLISMGGLTLGVGMLVDNSIVVLENIYRMRSQGKSVYVAAVQGAKQISPAIVASTLTTIIVFLPVLFIDGMTKEVISDMALTITFSLVASLISALCVVPMSASLMKNDTPPKEGKIFLSFKTVYAKLLNKALNNKVVVIVVVVSLFCVSALGATTMGLEFFSAADEGGLTISVDIDTAALTIKNANIDKSSDDYYSYDMAVEDTVAILEDTLKGFSEVETIGIAFSTGMSIAGVSFGSDTITATVSLNDYRDREYSTAEIIAMISEELAFDAAGLFTFSIAENTAMDDVSTFISDDITISYYSDDLTTLLTTGSELSSEIAKIEGVTSVSDGSSDDSQQYMLIIDKEKASAYGLTVAQAYLQIAALITAPSQTTTVTLDCIDSEETEDYAVYVLEANYTALSWYRSYTSEDDYVRIYFDNNLGGIGDAEYSVVNTSKNSVFVKSFEDVVDEEGNITTVSTIQEIASGDYIPLTYSDGAFSYNYAVVSEVSSTDENGIETKSHDITYETKSYEVTDFTAYSTYFTEDVDLVMMELVTETLVESDDFVAESFYLYEILADESFVTNDDGSIKYRNEGDLFDLIPYGIIMVDGYSSIYRENGSRMGTITVKYDTLNYDSTTINNAITAVLDAYEETSHGDLVIDRDTSNAIMTEVFNTLYLVLALAIVLIYLVMVAQFQSIKSPFIIMFTIPLAFTGSLALLLMVGFDMSLLALLGLIVLMGIVVNNGIVFVDYANKLIENGTPKREALIRTGIDRIRPILMTAFTTIMAMMVMAVDTSVQGVMLRPLAIATIGGLAYATVLTLFFVPIIYDLFNRKEKDFTRVKVLESSEMEEGLVDEGSDILMPREQAILDAVMESQQDYTVKASAKADSKSQKTQMKKQAKLEIKREKVLKRTIESRNKESH